MTLNNLFKFIFFTLACQTSAQEVIPIHVTEQGYIIVQVTLNDSIPGNFVLDTGAGINVLSGKMFDKVKATTRESGFHTGFRHDGDRLSGKLHILPSIGLGEQTLANSEVAVFPPLDGMGIDGLLSLKFFEDTPFTIDYVNKEVLIHTEASLRKMTATKKTIPIETIRHGRVGLDVMLHIRLNDLITLDAIFDTGSGHDTVLVNPYYIEKLGMLPQDMKVTSYTKIVSGEQKTDWNSSLKEVRLQQSDLKINNVPVRFREDLIYEALIGSRLFVSGSVTFDLKNKRIFL